MLWQLLGFRLGGVHALIGSMRTLQSTLISYSKIPSGFASAAKSSSGSATGRRKKTEERIDRPASAVPTKDSCTSLDALWSDVPAVADKRFIATVPTTNVWITHSLSCDCPCDRRLIDEPRTQSN